MKQLLINFVGAPSSGKSMMAALTFVKLKTDHNSSELIQEYAKQLVWDNKFEELANQWYVTKKQYDMIKAVYGKVDYVVTDSPLLLGLYYNRHENENVCNIEKTEKMILSKMSEFDNIYIFLERNEEFPYEIEGRIHNEEQSKVISSQLLGLLDEFGIEYKSFKSDKKNVSAILDYILSKV